MQTQQQSYQNPAQNQFSFAGQQQNPTANPFSMQQQSFQQPQQPQNQFSFTSSAGNTWSQPQQQPPANTFMQGNTFSSFSQPSFSMPSYGNPTTTTNTMASWNATPSYASMMGSNTMMNMGMSNTSFNSAFSFNTMASSTMMGNTMQNMGMMTGMPNTAAVPQGYTKFMPMPEQDKLKDGTVKTLYFQAITRQPEYQNQSFEELRAEFYKATNNATNIMPQQQPATNPNPMMMMGNTMQNMMPQSTFDTSFSFNTMGSMNPMMGNTMQSFNQYSSTPSFNTSFSFQQPQAPTTIPSSTDFFNTGVQSFSQQSWSTPSFQSNPSFTTTTTPSFTGNWMQQPPATNTSMPSFSFDTNPSMNMMGMSMPSFSMSQPTQTSFSFDTNSSYNTGMNWLNPAPTASNTAFSYTMPQMQQPQAQPMMNWANPMAMQPAMPMMGAPAGYNFMQPSMPAATYNPSISYFGAPPTEDLNTILSNPYGANQSVIDRLAKATTEESAATTTTAGTQQQQQQTQAELLDATSKWDGKVFKTALVRPRLVSNKSRKTMFSAEDELEDIPQFDEPSASNNTQNVAMPSVSSVTELKRLTIDPGKDSFDEDELAINGHAMQQQQQDGLLFATGVPTLQPSQLQQHVAIASQSPSVQSTPPVSLHGTPMVQQPLQFQQQQQQPLQPTPPMQVVDDRQMPKLSRPDYYTEPSMADLSRMSAESRSQIHQFTVGRYNIGSIMFTGCTDVNNLDLDFLIEINQGSVEVYADTKFTHTTKPQVGTELNKPSVISLFVGKKKDFEKKLRKLVDAMEDATFENYDSQSGKWVFRVAHFTKWGLPEDFDESDEEEVVVQPKQQQLAPPQMEQDDESEDDQDIAEDFQTMEDVPPNEEQMIDREPEPARLPQQLGLNAYKIQRMNMLFDDEKPVQVRSFPSIPVIPPHRLHIMEQVQSLKYNPQKFAATTTAPTLPTAAFSPMKQPLVASKDTVVHKNLLCPQVLLKSSEQYSEKGSMLVNLAHSFGTRFGGVTNQFTSLVPVSGKPQQAVDIASKQLLLHHFPSTEWSTINALAVHNVAACEQVYVDFLEYHFANSAAHLDDNNLPMYDIPTNALSHYLEHAKKAHTNDENIWHLTSILFGTRTEAKETEPLARKYELLQWFKQQVANTPVPTTASANIKVLHYLTCYKIHEAVLEAQNAKSPMLALLISQFTNPDMKQEIVAALQSQTPDSEIECILLLLAGRLDMAITRMITKYSKELKLNWKHCLGMFLWYDEQGSHSKIEQLVRKYSQSKVAIPPTCRMPKEPEGTKYEKPQYDICYQLLQLYSGFSGVTVMSVCSAHPWTVEANTTRGLCLLFHLYQVLRIHANKVDAHGHVKGNWDALLALYVRYAHELEQAGHWHLALYIYCQAVAPFARRRILLKQILDRHVIASHTCTDRERWVLQKLHLPKSLLYASKAQKIGYMRNGEVVLTSSDEYHQLDSHLEQIQCLLEANMFEEANKLMCKHVAPFMLLATNKSRDIYDLLKQVANGTTCSDNGVHAATYVAYRDALEDQQAASKLKKLDKLLKMLSKWQNACTSMNETEAQQKREFVAVAEMMTKVSSELMVHEQTCAKAAALPNIPAAYRLHQVQDLAALYFK